MAKRNTQKKLTTKQIVLFLILFLIIELFTHLVNNTDYANDQTENGQVTVSNSISFDISSIPAYSGNPYVNINDNKPNFSEGDYTTKPFENYSDLDSLGRCGVAYANICKKIMPAEGEKRQSISNVKPSGWKKTKYEGLVEGNYLYNRCHLIGYQLAGENANEKNLITGTRYFNVNGMLPFEDMVDDYIEKNPKNHVLYRVTPIYEKNNLVANGVQMEAFSVEDNGKGVCFNVYVYNVQPGVIIDYATGESKLAK